MASPIQPWADLLRQARDKNGDLYLTPAAAREFSELLDALLATQNALSDADVMIYGESFQVAGNRVDPRRVRIDGETPSRAKADEAIAWESTSAGFRRYITQSTYEKMKPAFKRWYQPYRCATCKEGLQVPEGHVCRTSLLREMNDDLLHILGWPNFVCAPYAHLMKAAGVADIPPKSEAEQAYVLLWLLRHYLDFGLGWDVAAKRDIEAWKKKIAVTASPKGGL